MTTTKELDTKLKSLKNTQKITKTMKMVSASKLRKAHQAQANAKFYARQLAAMTSRITASVSSADHPLLMPRKHVDNVVILIITSDKGLCGAFNHNANRMVSGWIQENRSRHEKIELWCCGKRGFMYFERHDLVKTHYENVTGTPRFADAIKIGMHLIQAFQENRCAAVYLSYNQFLNLLSQKTVFEQILPIAPFLLREKSAAPPRAFYFLERDGERF